MSKGPAYFRPTTTVVDCTALDESMPVVMEFSPIGELILYNWDEESDIAMEALGLESQCVACSDERYWKNSIVKFTNSHFISKRHSGAMPRAMGKEAIRVGHLLKETIKNSYKQTPMANVKKSPFISVRFSGIYQDDSEDVGLVDVPVFSKSGPQLKKQSPVKRYTKAKIQITTTIQALVNMLPVIPGCLVYEPEEDYWTLAISIVNDWENDDNVVIRAIRRIITDDGSFGFERQTAIIEQIESQWVIAKWL